MLFFCVLKNVPRKIQTFVEITAGSTITKQDATFRWSICPEQQLVVPLRFLAFRKDE